MSINKPLLSAKINAFVAGKLQGKTATTALPVYTSKDPYFNGLGKFIRNPDCWLNGVTNISCFSPAQLSGANWWQRAGTLITRKHVLFAKHFVPAIITGGTPLVFVAADNTVIRRNLVQFAYDSTDIAVGLLDADVPANIKIAKVLPKNYTSYLDTSYNASLNLWYNNTQLYGVGLDQEEKALFKIWFRLDPNWAGAHPNRVQYFMALASDPGAPYASFGEATITGDSGNPFFLIIDNELVVLTTWLGPNAGPFITNRYDQTNALIESLSPGENYALTDANLAAAYENMQKLYLNPAGDGNLAALANWYQDAGFTVPAQALPASTDIPVLPWAGSTVRTAGGSGVLAGL